MDSLRFRTLLIIFGAALLPVVVLWVLFSAVAKPRIKEELASHRIAAVDQLSSLLQLNTEQLLDDLSQLASNPILTGTKDDSMRSAELQRLNRLRFRQISILDRRGFLIDTAHSENQNVQEYAPAFKASVATGKIQVSEPVRSAEGDSVFFPFFIPVVEHGEVVKVIKVVTKMVIESNSLESFMLPERGDLVLIDTDGRILYSQSDRQLLRPFTSAATNKLIRQTASGIFREKGIEDRVFAAAEVRPFGNSSGSRNWCLISLTPVSVANHGIRAMNSDFLTVVLVATFCAGFMSLLLMSWFLKPLETLAKSSSRAARGDFAAAIPMTGLQEIDQSGNAFNLMLNQISNQRDLLELEVRERTEELTVTLATLESSHNAIEDGLLIIGNDGAIEEANLAFCRLFDTAEDQLRITNDLDSVIAKWGTSGRDTLAFIKALSEDAETILEEEWSHSENSGQSLRVYSAPILKKEQELSGRVWVFRDLTQYRKLEEELRQSQKMEAVGTLAGGVAHDFNNLLTAISGNLSLVLPLIKPNQEASEMVETSLSVAGRATGLVRQLLSFSRKSQIDIQCCNLLAIANETETIVRHSLDPSITMTIDAPEDLWSVDADQTQMQQILMNLCVNARDAIGKGGSIQVRMRNESRIARSAGVSLGEKSDHVVVEVIDDGGGMPLEVKKKVFDPFFTTKEQGKGTGLGLSTCYGIATQHSGWMEVDSKLGEGSVFRLVLPRGKLLPTLHESEQIVSDEDCKQIVPSDYTILIADDEPTVRSIAEILLKRSGYKVLVANDGLEAVQLVDQRQGRIDLALLDLTMPRMDGREAFIKINELYSKLPVVICSGYLCDFKDFESPEGNIPCGFIQKPYPLAEMVDRIEEVLLKSEHEGSIAAA